MRRDTVPSPSGLGSVSVVTKTWRPTRSFVFDAAVMLTCVAVEVAFTVTALLSQPAGTGLVTATVLIWVGQLASDVSLLFRRRWPLLVLGIAVLAAVPVVAAVVEAIASPAREHGEPWMPVSIPIAAYSAVVYARHRIAAWTLLGVLAALVAQPWRLSWFTVTTSALFVLVPALLGMYVAARRRLIAALTDRAERAERERWLLAEQARVEERLRLASDMHDVVSHRVSLMVLQAGALRMTTDDETTRGVAEELRSAGSQALEELRDVIGVLRSEPPDATADLDTTVVELPDLGELADESRTVGVPVKLDVEDAAVTAAVGRTVYRVVQEALTNVRKHAPGAEAAVRVGRDDEWLRVSVGNGPPRHPGDPALAATGSGTGLDGLRQRVELLGGTLTADAGDGGGFTVVARLPRVPTGEAGRP
ncbi:histidine kinase [Stackebrandtia nassauensis DSM 44728]|uniref:histidine kinase n=1 Tax=Stackebrandtia nassauensis (strain DSM 44728 / CIP 108903 / NRRL B-16338 / NBRC 102104 / LLR-40K-21) TaxID=446470 RepID=D3PZI3_STANL|nr:histidine kinase [Stackebrandtia nassauensis DSM 44728]